MKRSALRDLFRHLVMASLPLTAGCAGDGQPPPPDNVVDGSTPGDATCRSSVPMNYRTSGCDPFQCNQAPRYVALAGPLPQTTAECVAVCQSVCPAARMPSCEGLAADGCALHGVLCYFDFPGPPGCTGRRPAGLGDEPPVRGGKSGLGAHFARMAYLEAASIPAFRTLARELAAHGAPPSLVAEARRALRDEVRHTRVTSTLARRNGSEPRRPRVAPTPQRPLFEVARENAVEGCVRESFGALVATYQALAAGEPTVRQAFVAIADDETGHAELAWAVAAWIEPRLSPSEREALAAARDLALREVLASATAPVALSEADRATLGLPPPLIAHQLAQRFAAHVGQRTGSATAPV